MDGWYLKECNMLTEKDYCDYETCVALRELGFTLDMTEKVYERNLMTNRYETTPKPLLYEAQKWLREEKEMVLLPSYLGGANAWICEICYKRERLGFGGYNQSYEEALSEGVRASIKILQDEQKENN
jgi:hypothetical protein